MQAETSVLRVFLVCGAGCLCILGLLVANVLLLVLLQCECGNFWDLSNNCTCLAHQLPQQFRVHGFFFLCGALQSEVIVISKGLYHEQ